MTSKNSVLGLSIIKIQEDGGFTQQNNQKKQNETRGIKAANQSAEMQKMLKINYNYVFEGIRKIDDTTNGKEICSI